MLVGLARWRRPIRGFGGDDEITAGDGDDIVLAGDGDDVVDAGDGDNVVLGDLGLVVVGSLMATSDPGFGGDDEIITGDGDDIVLAGDGDDDVDCRRRRQHRARRPRRRPIVLSAERSWR